MHRLSCLIELAYFVHTQADAIAERTLESIP